MRHLKQIKNHFKAPCEWIIDMMYYITHQWHNILYQLAQARPHNVLHFLVLHKWINLSLIIFTTGRLLVGSGGMCPLENVGFLTFRDCFWCILGVKLQKLDDLLLNLVVFEARRIKGVTPLRAAEAAKQLVIRVRRRKISTLTMTDSISLSLAAEGTMHE